MVNKKSTMLLLDLLTAEPGKETLTPPSRYLPFTVYLRGRTGWGRGSELN